MRRTFPAALAFAAVGFSALENGGFFATSWGWPTIAFLVTVVVVSLVSDRVRFARASHPSADALLHLQSWCGRGAGPRDLVYRRARATAVVLLGDGAHRAAAAAHRRVAMLALGASHPSWVAAIGRDTRRPPARCGARR